ncbi:DinB family protein [uncultured Winogradskyella sp.]|uniref:DinB family protein n=1 Tax=uncultured Winogradskyella sp. TaxID=395353 RepID=UPI0026162C0B|nr:DinB family protein [uncultured Winogradskyella sp.]
MISDQLNSTEYHTYYKSYIDNAADIDIVKGLKRNLDEHIEFYLKIPSLKHSYAYAEGKWTIKDILLHIIDTERIFSYRALRIARHDTTPLAGFEQDDYVVNGNTKNRTLENLLSEYKAVRQATIALFESFEINQLKCIGEASGAPISVRALGYIITGHENHHNQVIVERYL